MSGAWNLPKVPPPPPPPEPKPCAACKGMRAECVAPIGESSAALCWLCAHHVVDHECTLESAVTNECDCLPHEIYPGRGVVELSNAEDAQRFTFGEVRYFDMLWNGQLVEVAKPTKPSSGAVAAVVTKVDTKAGVIEIAADESLPPNRIGIRTRRARRQ